MRLRACVRAAARVRAAACVRAWRSCRAWCPPPSLLFFLFSSFFLLPFWGLARVFFPLFLLAVLDGRRRQDRGAWPSLPCLSLFLSEVSKRGWQDGVGDQQRPKYSKHVPQNGVLLLIRGRRKKGAEEKAESMAWEGFPCANPLCPPTPFRNF